MTYKILGGFQTLNIKKKSVGVHFYVVYAICQNLQQTENKQTKKGF